MDKRVDWKDRKMSVAMSARMQEVLRNGMSANHEISRRKGHNPRGEAMRYHVNLIASDRYHGILYKNAFPLKTSVKCCNSLQCFKLLRVHKYIIIKNQNYRIIFLTLKEFISTFLDLFWIKNSFIFKTYIS